MNLIIFLHLTYCYWYSKVTITPTANPDNQSWVLDTSEVVIKGFLISGTLSLGALTGTILLIWTISLICSQFHLLLCLGMTTNESMNSKRYEHFRHDERGNPISPFNRGCCHNCVDFFELRFMRRFMQTDIKDWRYVYRNNQMAEELTITVNSKGDDVFKV